MNPFFNRFFQPATLIAMSLLGGLSACHDHTYTSSLQEHAVSASKLGLTGSFDFVAQDSEGQNHPVGRIEVREPETGKVELRIRTALEGAGEKTEHGALIQLDSELFVETLERDGTYGLLKLESVAIAPKPAKSGEPVLLSAQGPLKGYRLRSMSFSEELHRSGRVRAKPQGSGFLSNHHAYILDNAGLSASELRAELAFTEEVSGILIPKAGKPSRSLSSKKSR